ncbi:hypothetical protein BHS06_07835 [Myxococcus xanthus]|uniref:hypothetical protein n=1 Tax=Myxococcus xanthus TaxID=34 RepID=UPI001129190D|nr:hypothetical protein [Myxococcus xanthus]QDE88891.1 hypothetical protein BHS06_07835 [Myxococcus xanthus]
MKNGHGRWFAWIAGVVLLVGCGPADGEATQPGEAVEEESSPPGIPAEYLGEGEVESSAICCNVKCSGTWYGPFPSIKYDLCAKYGRYYCPQKKLTYQGHAWRSC